MSIRNKVQLVGRLGQNPEIKVFGENQKLARFSVATSDNYRDKNGEWQENTTWHNLVAWRNVAERVEKVLEKGLQVMIEGKLVNRNYETKTGEKRYITEIEVSNFILLDRKNNKAISSTDENYFKASAKDEDLPF